MRYHRRRRVFYGALHRLSTFAIVLCGGGAIISRPEIFGILGAVLAAGNLVCDLSSRARDHETLFRRFSDLAIEVRTRMHEAKRPDLAGWVESRLVIEKDGPPIYYALEAECDNQVGRVWGRDGTLVRLGVWARVTMNWLRHKPGDFEVV